MNSVRYAQALQQENFEIQLYGVEGTSFFQSATELGLPIQAVPRNKKYFDFMHARSLAKIFQKDGIEIVHFRDNRDLDFLGWVNFFSFRKIKLVYHQAMQLGVPKKDIIHTFRFNRIDAWVSTLNYMKKQVLSHTKFPEKKLHVIPLGTNIDSTSIHSKEEARKLLNLHSDKFLVGVVGRLDEKKGQLEVIQGQWHSAKKDRLDASLTFLEFDPSVCLTCLFFFYFSRNASVVKSSAHAFHLFVWPRFHNRLASCMNKQSTLLRLNPFMIANGH